MNFGSDHYVPILKAKRAEKSALQLLAPAMVLHTTPLLEIVEMGGDKTPTAHLKNAFRNMAPSVSRFSRYFLDAHEIAEAGPSGAQETFELADDLGHPFTPVTGISRHVDVAAALAHREYGVAIRLTREEFESGLIPRGLPRWLNAQHLEPEEVDLVVDLGAVDDMIAAGIASLATAFLGAVPTHTRWRTLTVSGCAFPQSMAVVDRHSHLLVDRAEWQGWRDSLYAARGTLPRLPTFSDCTIQYPTGVEGFDPRYMHVSASVRYTLPDQWLLIKGESTDKVPATEQFPLLARQLVYGHLAPYFAGARHCAGCARIQAAANGAGRLGSPEVWRRLGTVHHITRAVQELQALAWP